MTGNDSLEDPGIDAAGAEAAAAPPTAGAILAQAREAAGLSVQDVAVQLRLAPRQVTAIERDDFASLPGRTFVRGFVRNYARLLKLDVDAILAALPGDGAAALDRPSLAATTRAIGELPSERAARPGVAKWAIPLVLIAIVAIAALYEFSRPPSPAPVATTPPAAPAPPPAAEPSPSSSPAPQADAQPGGPPPASLAGTTTTSLPNPVAAVAPAAINASAPAAPSASPAAQGAPNQLNVRFHGTSWIEVRDRSGNIVLSMTGNDGTSREIAIASPGEITVGNVAAVEASWRGRRLDLATQSKQNVARVRLD
ncbi:MAG: helix-turn-helix domain-containing protein [Betaproteobacteria bacterium]|nr:helix-turn-helix domain-containing protein [Betaproteobacteria bacterium]